MMNRFKNNSIRLSVYILGVTFQLITFSFYTYVTAMQFIQFNKETSMLFVTIVLLVSIGFLFYFKSYLTSFYFFVFEKKKEIQLSLKEVKFQIYFMLIICLISMFLIIPLLPAFFSLVANIRFLKSLRDSYNKP